MNIVLYNYWRSSASQRVRIALGLKGLPYEYIAVNIVKHGQFADAYRARNPMAQVPTLEITEDNGTRLSLTQSLPILEYLEERFPQAPLLPRDPYLRARARALAEIINSGIQPLQNLSVTDRIKGFDQDVKAWVVPFIERGLAAFAAAMQDTAGAFAVGDTPGIAECCLVPQLASARRFGASLDSLHQLVELEARCLALPAFSRLMPDSQPDAVVA